MYAVLRHLSRGARTSARLAAASAAHASVDHALHHHLTLKVPLFLKKFRLFNIYPHRQTVLKNSALVLRVPVPGTPRVCDLPSDIFSLSTRTDRTSTGFFVVHASTRIIREGIRVRTSELGRAFFYLKERKRRLESRHTAQAPTGDRRFAFVEFLRPCTRKRDSLTPGSSTGAGVEDGKREREKRLGGFFSSSLFRATL